MHDIDQGGYYTFDDKIYLTLDRRTAPERPYRSSPQADSALFLRE